MTEPREIPPAAAGRSRLAVPLAPIVVAAVALLPRLWDLDANGHGNPYYAAAALSMSHGWSNFFFNSFDPGGFITVDKPPVAQWIQAISVRLFGFGSSSLLAPQAVMGAAACGVLCHVVRRSFGTAAGVAAGLCLAVSPVNVAVDRLNLPDTALVLVTLLAAWALSVAVESNRVRPWLVCLVLVGVGFNVKMLAAFVVLPTFYAVYLLFGPGTWLVRAGRLAVGSVVLAGVSAAWMLAVDLTPPDRRPYVGGSRNNTVRDLALGYNGLGRVAGGEGNLPGPGGRRGPRGASTGPPPFPGTSGAGMPPSPTAGSLPFPPVLGAGSGGQGGPPGAFGGEPGWTRLGNRELAGQAMWLVPFALTGALATAASPLSRPRRAAVLLWLGWLATHAVVFSFSRGIMHPYYLAMLAPAVAGLVGACVAGGLEDIRDGGWRAVLILGGCAATALGQNAILKDYPAWQTWLVPIIWGGVAVYAVGLSLAWRSSAGSEKRTRRGGAALTAALLALSACPAAWAATVVLGRPSTMLPAADPALLETAPSVSVGPGSPGGPFGPGGMPGGAASNEKLVAFLKANRQDEKYLLVTPSAMLAAPLIIETREPVIAAGGFMGADPAMTADRLAAMVERREVRFVLTIPFPGPGGMRPPWAARDDARGDWAAWVRERGEPVDRGLWMGEPAEPEADGPLGGLGSFARSLFGGGGPFGSLFGPQLYDCRPGDPRVAPESD